MVTKVNFHKYQGTGNDFILIDQYNEAQFDLSTEQLAQLCDRRFGIGADGVMYIRKIAGYDFEMIYFNSDGRPSTMCGNGGRCIVRFAHDLGIITDQTTFMAVDGVHAASITAEVVALGMIDVNEINKNESAYVLDTGSPHFIQHVASQDELVNIVPFGKSIRYNETYSKQGINVNTVFEISPSNISMATYERGVEDETYSCGTGVTAAAIVQGVLHPSVNKVNVKTKGGDLSVTFDRNQNLFVDIKLIGPAQPVFKGTIHI